MSALENLPPDQRAVLQLVLQRGRSYDEIAQLLSIDRSAVRQRALDAFDSLTPSTALPGPEQGLVTDYLLGQLPGKVTEQVYAFLQASEADRAWAAAIVEVIRPLVNHALPEIPDGGAERARAPEELATGDLESDSDSPVAAVGIPPQSGEKTSTSAVPQMASETGSLLPPAAPVAWAPEDQETRPVSRRGGAILLSIVGILIAAAIIVAVVTSGGGRAKKPVTSQPAGGSQVTSTSTTPAGSTTGTATATSTTTPQILAQLNLTSPTGASSTLGIAQVVREGGIVGIVIDAKGVPPNTSHNAYAVWLYNSPSSHKFVGFDPSLVGKDGKLVTEGQLPTGAAAYHRLLITLETQSKPTSPGEIVLSAPFREQP